MLLSVERFKGIESIKDFSINPLTILAGSNSSGKSTLIQLLLMLKQTLESNNNETGLILNKPYVSLGRFKNIIHNNDDKSSLRIQFKFLKEDFLINPKSRTMLNLVIRRSQKEIKSWRDIDYLNVDLRFKYVDSNSKVIISKFNVEYSFNGKKLYFIAERKITRYLIISNSNLFFDIGYRKSSSSQKVQMEMFSDDRSIEKKILDTTNENLFKETLSIKFSEFIPYSLFETDSPYPILVSPILSLLRVMIRNTFDQIKYIGPLREAPKPYYFNDDDSIQNIGNKGEYVAHILAENRDKVISNYRFDRRVTTLFKEKSEPLIDAVEYWLCHYFEMAQGIEISKGGDEPFYILSIKNYNKINIPINQVGFGVSQILPVIVQGLMLEENETMILEQPEIHLHPKVQSKLFDFIISLNKGKRKVLVETHSDHLITRMRRRIAENVIENVDDNLAVYFVGRKDSHLEYSKLGLNDMGNFDKWPKDFFDEKDSDLRAMLKAQIKKRAK